MGPSVHSGSVSAGRGASSYSLAILFLPSRPVPDAAVTSHFTLRAGAEGAAEHRPLC